MTESKRFRGRIPASELPAVRRWQLPQVEGGGRREPPFQIRARAQSAAPEVEELDLSGLTVDALQKLRDDAHAEGFEQGLREGREKGEAEGYAAGEARGRKEGHERAWQEAAAEIESLKARLGKMIATLQDPYNKQQTELEQTLLRLVSDVARAVVGRELATRPELLEDGVRKALQVLPQQERLTLIVHPDDVAVIEDLREREGAEWEIRGDETLAQGDLRVRSLNAWLEYSVEGRFRAVMEQLLEDAAAQPPGGDGENA